MHLRKVMVPPYGEKEADKLKSYRTRVLKSLSTEDSQSQEVYMLGWAVTFFIVALIAGVLGFTGVAVAAAGIAKILFFIFLVLFLLSLVGHLIRRV